MIPQKTTNYRLVEAMTADMRRQGASVTGPKLGIAYAIGFDGNGDYHDEPWTALNRRIREAEDRLIPIGVILDGENLQLRIYQNKGRTAS